MFGYFNFAKELFQGIKEPHEAFFWPEALLPKVAEDEDDESVGRDERLDRLESGYSDYVQDDVCDDGSDDDDKEEEEMPSSNFSVSILTF